MRIVVVAGHVVVAEYAVVASIEVEVGVVVVQDRAAAGRLA